MYPSHLGPTMMACPFPPFIAFYRLRNLKDLLVRASFMTMASEERGKRPFGAVWCKTCSILISINVFSSHRIGEQIKVSMMAFYKSSNTIYLIMCRICGQQCMGKTGQPLPSRMNGHRFNTVHQRMAESPMAAHLNSDAHFQADMAIMVIDQINNQDSCLHKNRESRWIRTLETLFPSGMKLKVDSL